MKLSPYLIILILFNMITSCKEADCLDCEKNKSIEIKFDWSKIKTTPEGMKLLIYNDKGDLAYSYNNLSPLGGKINIDAGTYTFVCYNNDSEYVQWRNQDHLSTLEAFMREGNLTEDHTRASSPPIDDKLIVMPDYLCGNVQYEQHVDQCTTEKQDITLYPTELIDHYTYKIYGIIHSDRITKIRATLSGLASGLFIGNPNQQSPTCSMPFNGNVSNLDKNLIEGNMLNFGYSKNDTIKNLLTLYIWSKGGNVKGTWNVTNQVRNAPDPHHVTIIIDANIILPDIPDYDVGDGFEPSVDDWININEDIDL